MAYKANSTIPQTRYLHNLRTTKTFQGLCVYPALVIFYQGHTFKTQNCEIQSSPFSSLTNRTVPSSSTSFLQNVCSALIKMQLITVSPISTFVAIKSQFQNQFRHSLEEHLNRKNENKHVSYPKIQYTKRNKFSQDKTVQNLK